MEENIISCLGEDNPAEFYRKWKGWVGSFGYLKATTKSYYEAEIRRAGLTPKGRLRVLEVGFGNGSFLAYARQKGWIVVGLEKNSVLVDEALSADFDARVTSDLSDVQDSEFDLVIAFDVIEHLEEDEIISFMQHTRRILRPSGRLIARVPNGDSPFGLKVYNGDFTHRSFLGSGKLQYLASSFGFRIIFLGAEAEPIIYTSFLHFSHRLLTVPVKRFVDLIIRLIYYPRERASFCSANITFIFQK